MSLTTSDYAVASPQMPLLTLQALADLHQCSHRHARDTLVKLPGFPPEAPTSTPRHRLWVAREILSFINRDPAPIAH